MKISSQDRLNPPGENSQGEPSQDVTPAGNATSGNATSGMSTAGISAAGISTGESRLEVSLPLANAGGKSLEATRVTRAVQHPSAKDRVLQWVNWVLMVDLFFVLFCFFWFAVALVGRSANFPLGFDLWYRLWEPVVQPALGILMAGALISGVASWLSQRFGAKT